MTRREQFRRSRMARLDPIVRQMYADYQSGLTLSEVAEKHGRRGRYASQTVWHLFHSRGLKCRPRPLPRTYEQIACTRRAHLDAKAPAIWAAYQRTNSCAAVAREFGSDKATIKYVLRRNGYEVREIKSVPRQANGSPVRYVPKTDAELRTIAASMTMVAIPDAIRFEWRQWSLARRGWFISLMREHLPSTRPAGPLSKGMRFFDYGSPEAHRIADRMNRGRNSRTKSAVIRLGSEGVIFEGKLWFWVQEGITDGVGAYYTGRYVPGIGRPALHRTLWARYNGRPVPRGHVVRHADGNKNNFSKGNLVLATQNDVARENQAAALARKSRVRVELLLRRANGDTPDATRHLVQDLVNS